MSFFVLIIKNLFRRRTRSLLTIVGIAVGIAAVVALTSVAWGFEHSWVNAYNARGVDLIITKTSSRSVMPAPFSRGVESELQKMPHVQDAPGVLADILGVEESPSIVVAGWETGSYLWDHLKLEEGRWPVASSKAEVALGNIAADMLGKKVGDPIQLESTTAIVTAIYSSASLAENGSIVMPLETMQAITDHPGMINFVDVRLAPHTTEEQKAELRAAIKARYKDMAAFVAGEVTQNNTAIQLAKAMSLATSFIALVVGTIGIMNTILMSVFERLQEIGVLLAIGWRRARILRMILIESLLLSVTGGVVGCALGVCTVRLLEMSPWIRGKLEGEFNPTMLGIAMLIALALGALGGIYPAWVGSRMSPVAALRHE